MLCCNILQWLQWVSGSSEQIFHPMEIMWFSYWNLIGKLASFKIILALHCFYFPCTLKPHIAQITSFLRDVFLSPVNISVVCPFLCALYLSQTYSSHGSRARMSENFLSFSLKIFNFCWYSNFCTMARNVFWLHRMELNIMFPPCLLVEFWSGS